MQEQSGVWKSQIIYIGLLENWCCPYRACINVLLSAHLFSGGLMFLSLNIRFLAAHFPLQICAVSSMAPRLILKHAR